jgi:hypothetical protein
MASFTQIINSSISPLLFDAMYKNLVNSSKSRQLAMHCLIETSAEFVAQNIYVLANQTDYSGVDSGLVMTN